MGSRKRSRIISVRAPVALGAAVFLTAAVIPGVAGATSGAAAVTPDRVAHDVQYRSELHLKAEPAYVRSLYGRGDATRLLAANGALGALFTHAEATELKARDRAVIDGQEALDGLALPDDVFAGQYLDHRSGSYVVLVTRDAAQTERRLDLAVPHAARLAVLPAAVSYAALLAATETLALAGPDLEARGVPLVTLGPDTVRNRLQIGTTGDVNAARDAVRELVDVPFTVVAAPENTRRNNEKVNVTFAPPIRGGIDFRRIAGSFVFRCSTGFVGYSPSGGTFLSNVTEYYMVSAGHCGPTTAQFTQAAYPMGSTKASSFSATSTTADALAVNIAISDRSNQMVLQYNPSTGATTIGTVVSVVSKNTGVDVVGGRVCHDGTTTTTATVVRCGAITAVEQTVTYSADPDSGFPRQTISRLRFANLHSDGGDSGASIFGVPGVGYQAEGILSGGPADDLNVTFFSQIRDVMARVGVQSIKTSANGTID